MTPAEKARKAFAAAQSKAFAIRRDKADWWHLHKENEMGSVTIGPYRTAHALVSDVLAGCLDKYPEVQP
jgi:hypothetical protein